MTAVNMHELDQKMSYLQARADAHRSSEEAGEYKPALNQQEFGQTAYTAFALAFNATLAAFETPVPAWPVLPEDVREDWSGMATAAVQRIVTAESVPFERLACVMRNTLAQMHGRELVAWENLNRRGRLVWEAVARHLANMALYEDGDDVQADVQEQAARTWILQKLAQPQGRNS